MASRKRKQCPPQRLSGEKRQKLAWDMTDLIIRNNVDCRETESGSSGINELEDFGCSGPGIGDEWLNDGSIRNKSKKIRGRAESRKEEIVELNVQSSLPTAWHCVIGTFRVSLHHLSKSSSNNVPQDLTGSRSESPCDNYENMYVSDEIEVKVTLSDLERVIDLEMGHKPVTHGSTSLHKSLRSLSLKGTINISSDKLEALDFLQDKGLATLVMHMETSIFDDSWNIMVCLSECALTKMKFASQDTVIRKTDKMIKVIMSWFYKDDCATSEAATSDGAETGFDSLYEAVKKVREAQSNDAKEVANKYYFNSSKGVISNHTTVTANSTSMNDVKCCGNKLNIVHGFSTFCINKGEHSCINRTHILNEQSCKSECHCRQLHVDSSSSSCSDLIHGGLPNKNPTMLRGSCVNSLEYLQHSSLLPTLRQYQMRAVQWMIHKEKGKNLGNGKGTDSHPLWKEYCTLDGKVIFFNPFNGRLTTERFQAPPIPSGGILADEMGLGKTVEVLACVLNNPMQTCLESPNTCNSTAVPSPGVNKDPALGVTPVLNEDSRLLTNTGTTNMNPVSSTNTFMSYNDNGPSIIENITLANQNHVPTLVTATSYTSIHVHLPCMISTSVNQIECKVPISQADHGNTVWEHIGCKSSSTVEHSASAKPLNAESKVHMPFNPESTITADNKKHYVTCSSAEPQLSMPSVEAPSASILNKSQGISYLSNPIQEFYNGVVVGNKTCLNTNVNDCHDKTLKYQSVRTMTADREPGQFQDSSISHFPGNNQVVQVLGKCIKQPCDAITRPCPMTGPQCTEENLVNNKPTESGELIGDQTDSFQWEFVYSTGEKPQLNMVEMTNVTSEIVDQKSSTFKDCSVIGKMAASEVSITCQCVCGSNDADLSDRLLQCTQCQVVLHAECLGHHGGGSSDCTITFLCPHCAVNRPPIPSRATLIISPVAIAHQWVEEITRHTTPAALRILVYEGVAKQGFIQPEMLADHDIVLTTYATLRADFYHLGPQQGSVGRSMRHQKRYIALPSPLMAIKFWRICLDEAQMVESTTAKAAEMALRLQCVHRWCVTGTPIQKGLEDLYGLLLFLGVFPYCQRIWWKKLLYEPYMRSYRQPMYDALADVLWRTAKKDVLHEIQLPSQTEHMTTLTFTPVEQHFYQRQHEECSATTLKILSRWSHSDTKLSSIDRSTVHKMLIPLLRLRQACCHPQAVRGGFLSMQKSTLTMDQLLESLIARTKLECEEAHRQLLFAINGLAGTHMIKREWPEAVERYRDAMRSWMDHEDKFRTDALQKLHTLYNLTEVLLAGHSGCSRTLRDDKLKDQAEELKRTYMTKPTAQVQTALYNLTVAEKTLEEIQTKVQFQSPWWILAIQNSYEEGLGTELLHRVRDELSTSKTGEGSLLDSVTDLQGLQYVITTKLDMVESTHDTLVVALDKLRADPTPQMVHSTAECCLRSKPNRKHRVTRCQFCEVDDIFTEYESRLFGHQGMKGVSEQEFKADSNLDWHRHGNTGGLRAETETEKALKAILVFVRSQRIMQTVYQEARHHLTFIEGRKKEFKFLRAAWFALRERVSSLDELDMCTTRLRGALPGEIVAEDEKHVIYEGQVEQERLRFISDRVIAQTELRKKLGQYLYLINLAKTQASQKGENPDLCPVCTRQLGKEWSVFSCGHCYCCECVWVLLRQAGIGPRNRDVHIKCPMCRVPSLAREISYVSTAKEDHVDNQRVPVKGSHSTKVEAVVRTLLMIRAEDDTAKCLVFSTWQDVLEVIGKALKENNINYKHINTSRRLLDDLHAFKVDPAIPVLLLPLQTGSNGLNIVEATHVLLVEPALNPAHELQAVGRVHRIGQTRPTHVYRFVIRGTVESRMYSLLRGKCHTSVRTGSRDTENSSLTIGDLTSLFTREDDADQLPGLPDQEDQER